MKKPPIVVTEGPSHSLPPTSTTGEKRAAKLSIPRTETRPLRDWAIYAVILGGVFSFIAGKLIFSALLTDHTGLCLTIFILFVAAAVRNFFDISYIQAQAMLAEEQTQSLIELNNVVTFLKQHKRSVFYDHINNLYEIARRDTTVSQDNLIVLLQSRLNSRTRLTNTCSGLLVTLGLVGTIVGLIVSIAGLGTVMESVGKDKHALLSGLQGTLAGMGTAFYTTLLGAILGGIILRTLGSVVESHGDHLIARIAELSEVYIVPTLRRTARRRIKDDTSDANERQSRQETNDEIEKPPGTARSLA